MKIAACFMFLLCLLASTATYAQERPNSMFLKLETGEVIPANKIQLKSPLFKSNHFLVNDSLKFNPSMVRAFQNENGFYARIQAGSSYDSFAKRLLDGPRIDRFSTTRDFYDYSYGGYSPYGYGYGMPRMNRRRINFFSKDEGPLYEVSYENLMQALADNEASIALLQKHRKEKLINTGVTIVGSGLLLLGSYLSVQDIQNRPEESPFKLSPVFYAGAGVLGAQLVFNLFQKDKLVQAMEVYNYRTVQ